MARPQPPHDDAASRAERKWLKGTLRGTEEYLEHLRARLRAMGEDVPAPIGAAPAPAAKRAGITLATIEEQLAHVHYDLVAIRAHLGLLNPGCAPAEEHTNG